MMKVRTKKAQKSVNNTLCVLSDGKGVFQRRKFNSQICFLSCTVIQMMMFNVSLL